MASEFVLVTDALSADDDQYYINLNLVTRIFRRANDTKTTFEIRHGDHVTSHFATELPEELLGYVTPVDNIPDRGPVPIKPIDPPGAGPMKAAPTPDTPFSMSTAGVPA